MKLSFFSYEYIHAHKHFFHLEMERISNEHAGNERKPKRAKISNKQRQAPKPLTP